MGVVWMFEMVVTTAGITLFPLLPILIKLVDGGRPTVSMIIEGSFTFIIYIYNFF